MSRMKPGVATCEPDNALEDLLLVNASVEKKRERLSTTRKRIERTWCPREAAALSRQMGCSIPSTTIGANRSEKTRDIDIQCEKSS